jgi:virginiamycin B lyase
MGACQSTRERTQRPGLATAAAAVARGVRVATALLAAHVLILTFAPRAEAYIYWAKNDPGTDPATNVIGRANLDGTDRETVIRGGEDFFPFGVTVSDTHIYWDNGPNRIGRANLDGTAADQSFIAASTSGSGVAVDDAHVYWVSKFSDPGSASVPPPGTGAIGRANLDGSVVDESFITGISFPTGVAVGASHLYWTSYHPGTSFFDVYRFPSRIGRANLDGTGVDEGFIAGESGVADVAVDDTHIWWAYAGRFTGGIGRANLDGTGRETVIGGGEDFFPWGVAVSDTHVYWRGGLFSPAGVPIGRARLDGSRANHELITGTGETGVGGVAVDELPFSFGELKRNRRRGTATLTVNVPGAGQLELAKTKKVKAAEKRADAEGGVKLPVKARAEAKKRLATRGKAKVKAKVSFAPDEGEVATLTKPLKLIKRR